MDLLRGIAAVTQGPVGSRVLLAEPPDNTESIVEYLTASLAAAAADTSRPLGGVVHQWSLDAQVPENLGEFQAAQERGVLSEDDRSKFNEQKIVIAQTND